MASGYRSTPPMRPGAPPSTACPAGWSFESVANPRVLEQLRVSGNTLPPQLFSKTLEVSL
jgi:hypothetical protein